MVSGCIKDDQERQSNCRHGPGLNAVFRPGDGNRPLLTRRNSILRSALRRLQHSSSLPSAPLPTSGVADAGGRIPRGRYDFVEGLLNPNGILIVEVNDGT